MILVVAVTVGGALVDVGRSLREAFFMFWETLWPLVLGFGLSGAVQAFVRREQMERTLGDHGPAAVARASVFGMASSSCSYAASAMAKSLFQKGADFIAALIFMFASTNLVLELGIVLAVLMGWQFVAAEFVGGPVMIALLAVVGGVVLTPKVVAAARRRVATTGTGAHEHVHAEAAAGGDHDAGGSARRRWSTVAGWSEAASFTMSDLGMLRRELAVGYLVAGFLAVLVPTGAWNALFVHGHGAWTVLENVVVAPVIAFLSFVCSIGNVPMAAALWKGGISFGGVITFVFADLLAAPLVLVYRRYYGGALTLRLAGLFWAVMAVAGLVVEVIFSGSGIVPTHRPVQIVPTSFHWNATTYLNIVALVIFAALVWLHRHRAQLGGSAHVAGDPVCGMLVDTAAAPTRRVVHGREIVFCSEHCAARFDADPEHYLGRVAGASAGH